MATTVFNTLVIEVARRLQEPYHADAGYLTGTFDRYSAILISGYLNSSVRDLVKSKLMEHGENFPDVMPEMLKSSGVLALTDRATYGELLKSVDCLLVLGVRIGGVLFRRIPGRYLTTAMVGVDPSLAGTAEEPTYFEQGQYLYTLGVKIGNVILDYIIRHQSIVVSTAAAGNGKWLTGANSSYVLSTKTLSGSFSSVLAAGDAGKKVLFRTAVKTYEAWITSRVSDTSCTIDGTNLPVVDIAAGNVLQILISDQSPETTDLQLSSHWHTELVELAIQKGILDAERGLLGARS